MLALALIGFGALYLVANLLNLDADKLFWPLILILVGGILIFRPDIFRIDPDVKLGFVRNLDLDGNWKVENKSYMNFVGEFDLDLREAEIPAGETVIRLSGFVNEVKLRVPEDIGVRVDTSAFVTEGQPFDAEKTTYLLNGMHYKSEGYETAKQKIHLEMNCFVADVRLKS